MSMEDLVVRLMGNVVYVTRQELSRSDHLDIPDFVEVSFEYGSNTQVKIRIEFNHAAQPTLAPDTSPVGESEDHKS